MTTSWQLNGSDLTAGGVTVIVDANAGVTLEDKVRWQREGILHGREQGHKLGETLTRGTLRFLFIGAASARTSAMQAVRRALLDNDHNLLTAPDAPANQFYWPRGQKDANLETDVPRVIYMEGVSAVALEIAFVLRDDLQEMEAVVTAAGSITATARRELEAIAAVTGAGSITATALYIARAIAAVTGAGNITAFAFVIRPFSAAVTGGGNVTATASIVFDLLTEDDQQILTEDSQVLQGEM